MTPPRELKYPLFIEASHFASDVFWRTVLEHMAFGECPLGARINALLLLISDGGKTIRYEHAFRDAQTLHSDVVRLLQTYLGLQSKNDFIRGVSGIRVSFKNWKDIKKASIRALFINNYVSQLSHSFQLTIAESIRLYKWINTAFTFKLLTGDDVVYDAEEQRIKNIRGVRVTSKRASIERAHSDAQRPVHQLHPEQIPKKRALAEMWVKYTRAV